MFSETFLVSTYLKGDTKSVFLSEVLTIGTELCTVCIGGTKRGVLAIQKYILTKVHLLGTFYFITVYKDKTVISNL